MTRYSMAAGRAQMDVEEKDEKGAKKSKIDELEEEIKRLKAKAEEKQEAYNDAAEEWEADPGNAVLTDRKERLKAQWEAARTDLDAARKEKEEARHAMGQQGKQEVALAGSCTRVFAVAVAVAGGVCCRCRCRCR